MNLEIIILSEANQRKTDVIGYHLHVKTLKRDTNELVYKAETDSQTLLLKGNVGRGGLSWEVEIDIYTRLLLLLLLLLSCLSRVRLCATP